MVVCFNIIVLSIITFFCYRHWYAITYKGKKSFFPSSRVIHQKKCLLSLMTMQKFVKTILKKVGVMAKHFLS